MEQSKPSMTSEINWSLKHLGNHRKSFALLLFLYIASGVIIVPISLYAKNTIDAAGQSNPAMFLRNITFLAGCLMLSWVISLAIGILFESLNEHLFRSVQHQTISTAFQLRNETMDRMKSGDWQTLLEADAQTVASGWVSILPETLRLIVRLISCIIMLNYFNAQLIIWGVVIFVLMSPLLIIIKRYIMPLHQKAKDAEASTKTFAQELLFNRNSIKVHHRVLLLLKRFDQLQRNRSTINLKCKQISLTGNLGFMLIANLLYILVLYWGGSNIIKGILSYGQLIAVLQITTQLQGPMINFVSLIPQSFSVLASIRRIVEFEGQSAEQNKTSEVKCDDIIALKGQNLSYQYRDSNVFSGIDLKIERYSVTGITGASGIGKTTLLKLISGLYQPQSGQMTVHLKNGDEIPVDTLKTAIFSYVSQDFLLLSGTIYDNISFMDNSMPLETLQAAAKIAEIDDYIITLEHGYQTVIGENNHGLSRGQAQRLAIARALANQTPFIIFDEATSALDIDTEERILRNIKTLTQTTFIIVTHHPSVAQICDKLIVLEKGGSIE